MTLSAAVSRGDTISGDLGDDTLRGGQGDDIILGGNGADSMSGELGDDRFSDYYISDWSGDKVDGGLGTDTVDINLQYNTAGVTFTAQDPTKSVNMLGGSGTDTVYIDLSGYQTTGYSFDVVRGKGTLPNGSFAQHTEIFNVFTAYGNDILKAGNALRVWFRSDQGND